MWSRARVGEWARVRVDDAEKAASGIRLSSRPTARKHEETGDKLASEERRRKMECYDKGTKMFLELARHEGLLLDIVTSIVCNVFGSLCWL